MRWNSRSKAPCSSSHRARLESRGARHRPGVDAQRMPKLDPEDMTKTKRNEQARYARDQSKQIVLLPDTDHALEELAAVKDSDPVQEHDQACQADWSGNLRLGRERADREADEQDRADLQRKSGDADLADQVAQSDRQKGRQYGLASNDIARKVQHLRPPIGQRT